MTKHTTLLIGLFITLLGCTASTEKSSITNPYFEMVRQDFSGEEAFATTAFVEQYWRVAGNTGYNATIHRIAAKLEEAGYVLEENAALNEKLTYRIETRAMDQNTWEPVDARLAIVGSDQPLLEYRTNRNMICKNSSSTPSGGVVGEVVYIENKEALATTPIKGKIVFAEMSPSALYKSAIVEGGALGLITYNNPTYLQPEKNTTSIQFRSLPYNDSISSWGIALSYDAREKLKAALQEGPVNLKVDIQTKDYPSEELTIVANIKGTDLPDESFVFSAHIQEPGANDNASGVGAQLEMAIVAGELIKSKKLDTKRTLTFLWGDEIISTRRYIAEKEKRNPTIKWGISLDMVGENTSVTGGSFLIEKMPDPSAIWTRGNDEHTEWGGRVLTLEDMKPHYLNDLIIAVFKDQGNHANWEVNTNPYEGGSDHIPFLRADIPGLLLWHFTDQFYHTDNDRIDKVSQETLKNVGISALVSALTLVNADYSTANQVIQTLLTTAKSRLNDEFALSKEAISKGESVANETQILEAWSNWYQAALGSTQDMVAEPNEKLNTEIAAAQLTLAELTESFVTQLKE